jgi:hypothetical protein
MLAKLLILLVLGNASEAGKAAPDQSDQAVSAFFCRFPTKLSTGTVDKSESLFKSWT